MCFIVCKLYLNILKEYCKVKLSMPEVSNVECVGQSTGYMEKVLEY